MKKILGIFGVLGLTVTTGVSVVACGQKDNSPKNEIVTNLSASEFYVDKTASLEIVNYDQVNNLTWEVEPNEEEWDGWSSPDDNQELIKVDAQTNIANGYLILQGLKPGKVVLTLSATGKKDKKIHLTILKKAPVELDNSHPTMAKTHTSIVKIQNFSKLIAPRVTVQNSELISARLTNDEIQISGLNIGETSLTISARNVEDLTIPVTITKQTIQDVVVKKDLGPIAYPDKGTIETEIKLQNPKLTGVFTWFAYDVNSTEVEISSNNFLGTEKFTFSIVPKTIELSNETISVPKLSSTKVKILNFESLRNVALAVENLDVATVSLDNQGQITIVGVTENSTILTITADYAEPKKVTLTVTKTDID